MTVHYYTKSDLAHCLGRTYGDVMRAIKASGVSPALTLGQQEYYDQASADAIRAALPDMDRGRGKLSALLDANRVPTVIG